MAQHVVITLVNFNMGDDLEDCLPAIENIKHKDISVFLVDNGSNDTEFKRMDRLIAKLKRFKIVKCTAQEFQKESTKAVKDNISKPNVLFRIKNDNTGFSGATVLTTKKILEHKKKLTHHLWLNIDTIVQPDFLEPMFACFAHDKKVGIVGPKITNGDDSIEIGGKIDYIRGSSPRNFCEAGDILDEYLNVDFVIGACLLVRSDIYDEKDLFSPKYFLLYEDTFMCAMIAKKGYKVMVATKSNIMHKEGRSIPRWSNFRLYYAWRNAYWFVREFAPLSHKILFFFYVWGRFILSIPKKLKAGNRAGVGVHAKALWHGMTQSPDA